MIPSGNDVVPGARKHRRELPGARVVKQESGFLSAVLGCTGRTGSLGGWSVARIPAFGETQLLAELCIGAHLVPCAPIPGARSLDWVACVAVVGSAAVFSPDLE